MTIGNTSTASSSCTILYSTQTGRAKACARRTARILRETTRLDIQGGCTFDAADHSLLDLVASQNTNGGQSPSASSHFFLLFVSTTGDGEHCDTIQQTWKSLLKKSLTPNCLAGSSFALFCLGDRAYGPQFCAAGRKLAVRLMQLGMKSLCEVGYGDDGTPGGGVFADLDDWIQKHLTTAALVAASACAVTATTPKEPSSIATEVPELEYRVAFLDKAEQSTTSETEALTEEDEEWQHPQFASYRDFFACQAPMAAYSYTTTQPNTAPQRQLEPDQNKTSYEIPLVAQVECNERLTPRDWEQNTRHLRLLVQPTVFNSDGNDQPFAPLPYQAGDIATVLPSNPPTQVERFIRTLPVSLQTIVDREMSLEFRSSSNSSAASCLLGGAYPSWPMRCTLRGWLTYCADILSKPEREDLRVLSLYCSPSHDRYQPQRDKLFSLSETSESALYADYILREKRSWIDVFYDFDALRHEGSRLTVGALLSLLPPIRPRDFSIASSPSHQVLEKKRNVSINHDDPKPGFVVELCVAVVEATTPLGRRHHGLCSNYVAELQPNESCVRLWIRPGSFAGLPLQPNELHATTNSAKWFASPLICIGAGTGIAPLRGLILEREAVMALAQHDVVVEEQSPGGNNNGDCSTNKKCDNTLIFGCRSETADFYYGSDWRRLSSSGRLHLLPAFSRNDMTKAKVYVQHLVCDNADFVSTHLLQHDGAIFIAGNPKMARAVRDEMTEAVARILGEGGDKKAALLFKKLQARGRFKVEAWS